MSLSSSSVDLVAAVAGAATALAQVEKALPAPGDIKDTTHDKGDVKKQVDEVDAKYKEEITKTMLLIKQEQAKLQAFEIAVQDVPAGTTQYYELRLWAAEAKLKISDLKWHVWRTKRQMEADQCKLPRNKNPCPNPKCKIPNYPMRRIITPDMENGGWKDLPEDLQPKEGTTDDTFECYVCSWLPDFDGCDCPEKPKCGCADEENEDKEENKEEGAAKPKTTSTSTSE